MTMPHLMNCGHGDAGQSGWCLDCVRELNDRAERSETAAEVLGTRANNIERRWMETFEKRCAREHEMIDEAIDGFVDGVLGSLTRMGIDTTHCDGEDAPDVILSAWIFARLEAWRLKMDEVAHATSLWDAHAIAHNALKSEFEVGGGGGFSSAKPSSAEKQPND